MNFYISKILLLLIGMSLFVDKGQCEINSNYPKEMLAIVKSIDRLKNNNSNTEGFENYEKFFSSSQERIEINEKQSLCKLIEGMNLLYSEDSAFDISCPSGFPQGDLKKKLRDKIKNLSANCYNIDNKNFEKKYDEVKKINTQCTNHMIKEKCKTLKKEENLNPNLIKSVCAKPYSYSDLVILSLFTNNETIESFPSIACRKNQQIDSQSSDLKKLLNKIELYSLDHNKQETEFYLSSKTQGSKCLESLGKNESIQRNCSGFLSLSKNKYTNFDTLGKYYIKSLFQDSGSRSGLVDSAFSSLDQTSKVSMTLFMPNRTESNTKAKFLARVYEKKISKLMPNAGLFSLPSSLLMMGGGDYASRSRSSSLSSEELDRDLSKIIKFMPNAGLFSLPSSLLMIEGGNGSSRSSYVSHVSNHMSEKTDSRLGGSFSIDDKKSNRSTEITSVESDSVKIRNSITSNPRSEWKAESKRTDSSRSGGNSSSGAQRRNLTRNNSFSSIGSASSGFEESKRERDSSRSGGNALSVINNSFRLQERRNRDRSNSSDRSRDDSGFAGMIPRSCEMKDHIITCEFAEAIDLETYANYIKIRLDNLNSINQFFSNLKKKISPEELSENEKNSLKDYIKSHLSPYELRKVGIDVRLSNFMKNTVGLKKLSDEFLTVTSNQSYLTKKSHFSSNRNSENLKKIATNIKIKTEYLVNIDMNVHITLEKDKNKIKIKLEPESNVLKIINNNIFFKLLKDPVYQQWIIRFLENESANFHKIVTNDYINDNSETINQKRK